ncbi:MAG: HAMP domain-containing histidine kinase [Calditrichaeota bacterium]|nr:HAMP domain-containing histidine kinase [Calditrichota bacterium]
MSQDFEKNMKIWREKYADPEMRIEELFRNYNVSTEMIKRTPNLHDLLDLVLLEYIKRLDEIPGKDLSRPSGSEFSEYDREKLRSLIMFSSQAVLLKENSEIFNALEIKNKELEETTQELEKANTELKSLNRQYLNMLGFVSHELRSPLISILGFAELLDENLLGTLSDEQKKAVQIIMRSSKNLIEMIRNYLDLSKIEQGELKMEKRPLEFVGTILKPTLEEMNEQFNKKNMSVWVDSNQEEVWLFADEKLLRIVMVNILSNAVKYGQEGGDIHIEFSIVNKELEVRVTNTGRGVEESEVGKVFDKFTQLDSYDTKVGKGSGLGLYNTKYIVEKHGGSIWAESEFKKWFRIVFRLPLLKNHSAHEARKKNVLNNQHQNQTHV